MIEDSRFFYKLEPTSSSGPFQTSQLNVSWTSESNFQSMFNQWHAYIVIEIYVNKIYAYLPARDCRRSTRIENIP